MGYVAIRYLLDGGSAVHILYRQELRGGCILDNHVHAYPFLHGIILSRVFPPYNRAGICRNGGCVRCDYIQNHEKNRRKAVASLEGRRGGANKKYIPRVA